MQPQSPERAVLIMAAGRGVRMGGEVPKQFRLLRERPVIFHTVEAFHRFDPSIHIVVVLPAEGGIEWWNELVGHYPLTARPYTVPGGPERFFSVQNALDTLPGTIQVVGVHDGVRPLVPDTVIRSAFEAGMQLGSGIPAIPLHDSIREVRGDDSRAVDRNAYRLVQTPQCFRAEWLKMSYRQPFSEHFTDDASVYEAAGFPIHLVPGDRVNMKITAPGDLELAEYYWARIHSR